MKKSLILSAAVIATTAAMASAVESSNTFGVLKVTAAANQDEVVMSVPWVEVGSSEDIPLADLFTTASDLAEGDKLYAFSGVTYYVWEWNGTAWTSPKIFTDGVEGESVSLSDVTLPRGKAFILSRKSSTASATYYISGQYNSAAAATAITAGDEEKPGYTLIANTQATAIDLNSSIYSGTPTSGDKIKGTFGVYTYLTTTDGVATDGWYKWAVVDSVNQLTKTDVTLPQGVGAWYVRKGTEALTINWPAAE